MVSEAIATLKFLPHTDTDPDTDSHFSWDSKVDKNECNIPFVEVIVPCTQHNMCLATSLCVNTATIM